MSKNLLKSLVLLHQYVRAQRNQKDKPNIAVERVAVKRAPHGGVRQRTTEVGEFSMPTNWSQDSYIKAYRFAAQAHRGQTVPGTDLPYIMHVSFVCMEVIAALHLEKGHDENLAVQCALLHDVIEDTGATSEQVQTGFGEAVATGVLALSKDKALAKHLQLADSLRRIRQQPQTVWMVKLADRITNLQPPPSHWTQDKIVHYREEAVQIHQALKAASSSLASRLLTKIEAYKAYIE